MRLGYDRVIKQGYGFEIIFLDNKMLGPGEPRAQQVEGLRIDYLTGDTTHREAVPTSGVVGGVGKCAMEMEVVRVINIRISGTRPIVAMVAHVPQGASIQVDMPATVKIPRSSGGIVIILHIRPVKAATTVFVWEAVLTA